MGAGATALSLTRPATAAAAPAPAGGWRPDRDSDRFTLVVMPDTQYLFDEDRVHPAPLDASFRWLLDHARDENIVFLAHLGDLTQNGLASEFAAIGKSFQAVDRARVAYRVLAGNHDVNGSTTDQRGETPYLDAFGPRRVPATVASPDGYNTAHVFRAAGRDWVLLALDWRLSPAEFAWAQSVIDRYPKSPVIVTTHEIAYADDDGEAHLSDYGRQLWDGLIARNDQVFLTLNGHFRLYRFDVARNTIDVSTFSPYFSGMAAERRDELARLEVS